MPAYSTKTMAGKVELGKEGIEEAYVRQRAAREGTKHPRLGMAEGEVNLGRIELGRTRSREGRSTLGGLS